jgi:6-phosphogluconolactonase
MSESPFELVVQPAKPELLAALAERFTATAAEAIANRGVFSVALSGGSTPKAFYELLTKMPWVNQLDWSKVLVYFGDERAVSPEDSLSNYKMARDSFLFHVPIPAENVFRMEGEAEDLEAAANRYEASLGRVEGVLDVVLLGIGPDGHTASLFPHSPQLEVRDCLVTATPVASLEPHVRRLTLTYSAINQARSAWFLVTGADKAEIVDRVINGPRDVKTLPSQAVQNPRTVWFLDAGAAAKVA